MSSCVNLSQQFGHRYKIDYDQSHFAQSGQNTRREDPWYEIIPCRNGHIYVHGEQLLGVSTDHPGVVANKLKKLRCTTLVQDGEDGANLTFHVDHFNEVAEIIKPKLKRVLSEEERQRLAEMGRKNLERRRAA